MVFPGEYVVLTRDPEDIAARYHVPCPDCFVTVSSIPGMTRDDSGSVILARKNDLEIVDRIIYSASMNFPLLSSPEGVSLERINPEAPSGNKSNWHSAAGSSGFATPGYLNSQCVVSEGGEGFVTVEPEIFSPDNDGRNDIIFIRIRPDRPGYIANLSVYSSSGTLVRHLARNEMMAAESVFSWDGISEENMKAPVGIYIIVADLFNPDGESRRIKLPVVLAGSF